MAPTISPSFCTIAAYSCALTSDSPRTDLCEISDGNTVGAFNTATGDYTFKSDDSVTYPPGVYTFEITAAVGDGPTKTATFTFQMTL